MAVRSVEKIIDKKGESLRNVKVARDLLHKLHAEIKELKPNATEAYKQIEETIKETKELTSKLDSAERGLFETIVQRLEDSAQHIKTQILNK